MVSSTPVSLLPESSPDDEILSMLKSSEPLEPSPLSESPTSMPSELLEAVEPKVSLSEKDPAEPDEASLALPESLDPVEEADNEPDTDEDIESEALVELSAADTAVIMIVSTKGARNFIW